MKKERTKEDRGRDRKKKKERKEDHVGKTEKSLRKRNKEGRLVKVRERDNGEIKK